MHENLIQFIIFVKRRTLELDGIGTPFCYGNIYSFIWNSLISAFFFRNATPGINKGDQYTFTPLEFSLQ